MTITTKDIGDKQKLLRLARLAKKHNILRVGSAVRNLSTEDAINLIEMATRRECGLPEKYYHLLK